MKRNLWNSLRVVVLIWVCELAMAVLLGPNVGFAAAKGSAAAGVADITELCDVVKAKKSVALKYHYDPAGGPERVLQPYGVGFTKAKSALLFGLQISGHSKSVASGALPLPDWRNFTIKKILSLRVIGDNFAPRAVDPLEHQFITEFVCKNFD